MSTLILIIFIKNSPIKNYKYLALTGCIILILGIPFILRNKDARMEIYPAILLPSGAHLVHNNDTIEFFSSELYGLKDTRWEKINPKDFMHPIPQHYLPYIAGGYFGLKPFLNEFKLYKPPITFKKYNRFNENNLHKTKKFYRRKLRKIGFDDSIISFRRYKISVINDSLIKTVQNETCYSTK